MVLADMRARTIRKTLSKDWAAILFVTVCWLTYWGGVLSLVFRVLA